MNSSGNVVPSPPAAPTLSAASLTFAPSSAPNTTETTGEPFVTALPTEAATSHVLTYVFVPIGSIILVVLMAGIIVFLVRKSRLDKLRHHLMPLYNFDPAEEGEDWESELLEEGMDHRLTARMRMQVESPSPTGEPKLTFSRDSGL